jgi:general secretion pathway protein D
MRTSIVHAAFLVAVLLLLAPSHAVADGIVLSIQPVSSTVSVGSTFAVDVNISGVTDLYDYQFDLSFNPAVLQATNVLEGAFLSSGGATYFIPGTIDNTAGNMTFNADTLLSAISGVSGDGTLAVFDFTAIATGTSALNIDPTTFILLDSTLANINATTTNGSVTVQGVAVPEPSVLTLVSMGLLILAGLTLKRTIL